MIRTRSGTKNTRIIDGDDVHVNDTYKKYKNKTLIKNFCTHTCTVSTIYYINTLLPFNHYPNLHHYHQNFPL